MTGMLKYSRYAARMLLRNPGLSGISVVALGLGIGLTAVMFSIVYGALMRGLPYEDGEHIVALSRSNPSQNIQQMGVPIHDFVDWRGQLSAFEDIAGFYEGTVNLRGPERVERFDGAFTTASTFPLLGVQAVVGRTFREEETRPGASMTVILGHHVWTERFDADPGAVGSTVTVNGEPAEIIGVMPEGFRFPVLQDVWVPLRLDPLELERGGGTWLSVMGKLRPDATADQAMVELNGIAQRLATEYPETNEGIVATIRPFTESYIGDEAAGLLYTMLAAVSLVLLIACTNVANLLLARAAIRIKEVGIRTALGANRIRVIMQMIADAVAIALVGGVLGAAVAWIGIDLFTRAIEGTEPPYWLVFKLDGPILLFILGASVLAAAVSGAIPAWKATSGDVTSVLKDESRGSSSLRIGRLSRWLVVGEIAMSVGLLVAAGLMTKSITTLRDFDYGFDPGAVFHARVGLFETDFPDEEARRQFFYEVRRRMSEIPGVAAASLGSSIAGGGTGTSWFAVDGEVYQEETDYPSERVATVAPGYFAAFGASVVLGRDFDDADDADGLPVVIVNEAFARRYLGPGTPLGRQIRMGRADSEEPWRTVIGVVPDLYMQSIGNNEDGHEGYYLPLAQSDLRFASLVARGPVDPLSISGDVRQAVASVHADTPLYWVDTVEGRLEQQTWFYNVFGVLFMVFGGVALFLASVGLYGVMAFSVSRRTAEVGIRMALGAEGGQVLSMIFRQGMTQIGLGVVLGLGLAALLARALVELLFNVSPGDPTVFGTIVALLVTTGALASLIPAFRATRVDPVEALRYE
jgi:predicted permease